MSGADAPIGVFDSGVGGLTVVAELERRLPGESILYLGDTARLPYGSKSPQTVRRYTERNLRFLAERGVKAAVVACNTASALALDELETALPVVGVVHPGAAAAVAASRGRVGVLATASTTDSGAYPRAIAALDPAVEVFPAACPLFVPLVEEGWHDDPVTQQVARRYLEPLLEHGVDTLLLGCTHYPLLAPTLAAVAGPAVALVDSAATAAAATAEVLEDRGLLSTGESTASHFCLTDVNPRFRQLARTILDRPELTFEWVDVS